ncbi:hypothetical protein EG328_010798 [Venturia inaequalis]|uniref:Uncharacterized protein n=1 Tax=Venturia inaequalis TaxID=5025 RepID=A0A8H3V5K1_VENIN|nr:hypothetical protein EG328_010798 [Venturia inaequalis]
MKASNLAVSLLLAPFSNALPVIESRQSLPAWLSNIMPPTSTLMGFAGSMIPAQEGTITSAEPLLRKTAKRDIIRYGPFTLPANKGTDMPAEGGHMHGSAPPAPSKVGESKGDDMPGMAGGGAEKPAAPKSGINQIMDLLKNKPMDPNGLGLVKRLSTGFCKDCTVLSGKVDVVFPNGTKAGINNGVYLHHAVTMDMTKAVPTFVKGCGGIAGSFSPFIGGAVDGFTQYFTTEDGAYDSGFHLDQDTLVMQAEMVNYNKEPQEIYVQMDVEYMPDKVGNDAMQFTLAATECSSLTQSFRPPKNAVGEIKSADYPITADGDFIAARGHMHDSGTYVSMSINGNVVCQSNATYGGAGSSTIVDGKEWQTITKMSTCAGPIPVKKGDNVVIAAGYDTEKHPARESNGEEQESMGIMTFVYVGKK